MIGAGKTILVVEDETIIALMIQDTLEELGFAVAGPASRLARALDLARNAALDAALLDVNIAGELVYPAAQALKARNIPILFLTGYGAGGVPPDYAGAPVLTKPFDPRRLKIELTRLLPPAQA